MYKIYINDKPLFLLATGEAEVLRQTYPDCLMGRYAGQPKTFFHYVDFLEKSSSFQSAGIYADETKGMIDDFHTLYRLIEAAGGLVFNPDEEALFIYRKGKWDLPKGKIDPGETPGEAAVREVQEETGLRELTLGAELPATFHTYREKGKRILKKTHWFVMHTPEWQLTPQTEEDIEMAVWRHIPSFLLQAPDMYLSIREVVESHLKMKF